MVKRALTSYDTVCWLDRLSFAQEMRESHFPLDVYILPGDARNERGNHRMGT